MLEEKYVRKIFDDIESSLSKTSQERPSVTKIGEEESTPYRILVSTLISLRTKDNVTYAASKRLFDIAPTIDKLQLLSEETIANTIKPAGFYLRKASQLKSIADIIISQYGGEIPSSKEDLLSLPGVGSKTANLVLNLGFNKEAICVDCHVHEISNRLGWVKTKTPEATEKELEEVLPVSFWIEINDLFVRFGQEICTPVSPKCSMCKINNLCPKEGVTKSR